MTKEEARQKIEKLSVEINNHNHRYYDLSQPIIADYDFDMLLEELIKLETSFPELKKPDSPTQRVGGEITKEFRQVAHKYPMLSLGNTYSEGEILEFDQRVRKSLTEDFEYVCDLKFDGVAIGLTYVDGILTQAITRGDGSKGDDVTANVKTIRSIPLKLQGNYPAEFEIRGEIFYPHDGFKKLNEDRIEIGESPFANPRNAASGTLKMQDSSEVAKRPLECFLYLMYGEELPYINHYDNLQEAKKWGFSISNNFAICHNTDEIFEFIDDWNEARKTLPYDIDGVVIKINSLQQQKQLGFTAKSPRWSIAYKFKTERALTELLSIDYQVGRTGSITPVANLRPVFLLGTIIKRASLHNADIIEQLDVRIGDQVYIEKGGEIIPKIVSVNLSNRKADAKPVTYITYCPECRTELYRNEGESNHYCPNYTQCPPQIKGKLEHFISRKAMNIDSLGEGKIEILYDNELVHDLSDLYKLTYESILGLEKIFPSSEGKKERKISFKDKTAKNIIKGLEKSKEAPFEKVLFALGIRYVGETVARNLANHFQTIDALMLADYDTLISVEDIGERIAKSIIEYFSIEANINLIKRLKEHHLNFSLSNQSQLLSNLLEGKTFVVSGVFENYSRDYLKELIQLHGGQNTGSISAKTAYILAGENMGPAKLSKANKLGIPIIGINEFEAMIHKKSPD
ncbi:MAG: NAD-dependent DNA ligase LigA [Bacteroidetes bacterium]|nr:NAD-dependent DNA ligase LigA [Bacteroidota bacterium]